MSMPDTRYDMRRAHYEFKGESVCKSCAAPIEWWKTTAGKLIPVNAPLDPKNSLEPVVTHWVTCPNAAQHRKDGKSKSAPASMAKSQTEPATLEVMERELAWFAARHGCRAIVALRGEEHSFTLWNHQDPEQLRSDLITVANAAKRHLEGLPR